MPQDSLRSVVYRSFVKCDDPKGVVECGAIRKSKSGSTKMEHKIESQRKQKNSNTSLAYKAEKEEMIKIADGFHSPSSFQLMEVSRGARKLNHVIDSWSNGPSFDGDSLSNGPSFGGESKDIAKDLLKGALDLQESLIMLGKLQEASQYMARLKRRQKGKSERRRIDKMEIERKNSNRFSDQNYQMGFQRPRLSADGGSSRDCIEELRKVISESFARQNLLPNTVTEDNTFFHRRNLDSASDIPSTSSSQSSIVHSNNFGSTESSFSSAAPPKKAKRPNLIAKLMGLEELPKKPSQTTPQKQMESEKIVNQRKPIFYIDKPNTRKPQSLVQKQNPERRTLKEVLETMQFKGLLKSNSVKEPRYVSHHFSDSHSEERLIDNVTPIVLIKPLRAPCLGSKEPLAPRFQEEGAFNTKMMLRRLKVEEELESEEPLEPRFQEEGAFNTKMMLRRLKVKEEPPSKIVDCIEVPLNPNKMSRKKEAEEIPVKRLTQKEAANDSKEVAKPEEKEINIEANDCKQVVAKPEERKIKSKQKSSNKMKASGPVNHQPQKKEAIDKQADKIPKVMSTSRKPAEKEIVKLKNMSRSQDQPKETATKPRKPEKASNITKSRTPQQQSTTSKRTMQTIKHKSSERRRSPVKKENPVSEPKAAKPDTENLGCNKDDKRINHSCENDSVDKRIDHTSENDSVLMTNRTALADQLPSREETDVAELQIEENCNNNQSSLCEVMRPTSVYGREPQSTEVNNHTSHIGTVSKSFKTRSNLKALLSSSPSFLSHAEELFDLNVNTPTILETYGIDDFGVANVRLTVDCANELIARRSLPDSQTAHPLVLSCSWNSKICLSLHQLLDEVCDGVEALRSYSKHAGENLHTDSLYAILERDIRCKGVVSGIWDMAWRNGFSVNVAEQVVNDIEKLILSGLIEELFR